MGMAEASSSTRLGELCPIGQLLGRQNSPAARLPLFMHLVTEIG